MSIKIFELATELHVDNKIVQRMARQLGLKGLTSRSDLENAVAEEIRQAIQNSEEVSTDVGKNETVVRRKTTVRKKATPKTTENTDTEKSNADTEKPKTKKKTETKDQPAEKPEATKTRSAKSSKSEAKKEEKETVVEKTTTKKKATKKTTQKEAEKTTQKEVEKTTQKEVEKTTQKEVEKTTQKEAEKTTQKEAEKTTQKEAEQKQPVAEETKPKVKIEDAKSIHESSTKEKEHKTINLKNTESSALSVAEKNTSEDVIESPKEKQEKEKKVVTVVDTKTTPDQKEEKKTTKSTTKKPKKYVHEPTGRSEIKVIARKSEYDEFVGTSKSKDKPSHPLRENYEEDTKSSPKKGNKIKYVFNDDEKKGRKKDRNWTSRADNEEEFVRNRKGKKKEKIKHTFNPRKKDITIGERVIISDLASMTGVKATDLIRSCMNMGLMTTINNAIDGETAQIILTDFGIDVRIEKKKQAEDSIYQEEENKEPVDLQNRPPVVTVMGHVDHGKTSLLDKIRKSNVAKGEAGGITQHIAAYHVETKHGMVTFLDTPGHEAFTAMRARGANATDIVILVVAADDGPMPQTIEAINHAKAANVPIIVAINKCDRPAANPEKTMQLLLEHGLVAEEFGGDCTMVKVSAHTGDGISELLEMALLLAETMELKANEKRPSEGVVIESEIAKGRGNIVTVLVQQGILKHGEYVVIGSEYGRIRSLISDTGKIIKKVKPGFPVALLGINGLPSAGEKFNVLPDEKTARQISEDRKQRIREKDMEKKQKISMENLFESLASEEQINLNLIVKADVIGSVEAITEALNRQGNDKVAVQVIHHSVGAISTSDVTLATASNAIIVGFNVRPDANAKKASQEEGVEIRLYSVIYDLIDDTKKALEGMLDPTVREEYLGKADVLEIFNVPKIGVIAGCKVIEGKVVRDAYVRVLRDNIVIHEGKLASLKRFKDNVKEVHEGFECGLSIESYKSIAAKDQIEFVHKVFEKTTL